MQTTGAPLGELNSTLIQKVEELTLYLIEQNKTIQQQNQELLTLKEKVAQLEAATH